MKSCVSFYSLLFQAATVKTHTQTQIEQSADEHPKGTDRFVTIVDFSHQFCARKSTRAREVLSDMRTAK